jgi:hypothetical protein
VWVCVGGAGGRCVGVWVCVWVCVWGGGGGAKGGGGGGVGCVGARVVRVWYVCSTPINLEGDGW